MRFRENRLMLRAMKSVLDNATKQDYRRARNWSSALVIVLMAISWVAFGSLSFYLSFDQQPPARVALMSVMFLLLLPGMVVGHGIASLVIFLIGPHEMIELVISVGVSLVVNCLFYYIIIAIWIVRRKQRKNQRSAALEA
jgi:hypothetical protein